MADQNIPITDVASVPLAFLPHGANTGDTFMVTLVGCDGDEGKIKVAPTVGGIPQVPGISSQAAQAMPLNQLQSYLVQQQAQRAQVNPPPPVQ